MLVLIYDYLLLIYLDLYFAKSVAKREQKSHILLMHKVKWEILCYFMRLPSKHLLLMY